MLIQQALERTLLDIVCLTNGSSFNDMRSRRAIFSTAIDNQLGVLLDQFVIELVMISGQYNRIEAGEVLWSQRLAIQLEVVLAHFGEYRYMLIAVRDDTPFGFEQLHDFTGRRLTPFGYFLLIGDAINQQ